MKHYHSIDRKASLDRLIPDLFDYSTVLYIGARDTRFDFGEDFRNNNYQIFIIEAFKPNVQYLRRVPWISKVVHGDIREIKLEKSYDIVFWWHGCEHIFRKQLAPTLAKLEKVATKAVVLGCPWGKYIQGEDYGNKYERHTSHHDYEVFERLGYEVECLGERDEKGSNITCVKRIEKKKK